VQIGTTFAPGMALGPVSVSGGAQYEIELAYWLANGRWYLYFNGTQGSNVIGYYPVSLYRGGALATQASEIDYGGETTGTTSFPPMGSGAFANQGWQRAAYHRAVGYWPPPGGAMINANLTASQAWPGCYTAQLQLYAAPWSETLWFGGPGGIC
jgi:Neprosin